MQAAYWMTDHVGHTTACLTPRTGLTCGQHPCTSAAIERRGMLSCCSSGIFHRHPAAVTGQQQQDITLLGSVQQLCLRKRQAAAEVQCSSTVTCSLQLHFESLCSLPLLLQRLLRGGRLLGGAGGA